ncbi:MAG: hypothetical protein K5683_08320 [Prevotella sp.]|nr:hypothetical protein [Prevotella sp.]
MKINKIFLFATMASAALFTACSDDDDDYAGPGEWNATADYANIYFEETSKVESVDPTAPTTASFQVYRRVQHEYVFGKDAEGNIIPDSIVSDKIVTSLPARTVKLEIIENTNDVFTISDANFAEGDSVATVNVTYDGAEVGVPHVLKVSSSDPSLVSYYSQDITYTYTVTRVKWNLLGTGHIADNYYIGEEGDVEIYQRDDAPTEFRVMHPMDEMLAKAKAKTDSWAEGEFNGKQPEYITISLIKNNLVMFDSFNSGCYNMSYGADVWIHHPSWASSTAAESNWTHNKVLSYQSDGKTPGQIQLAPWYYMDGVGGWNQTQADGIIVITFPGYTPKYVASLENEDFGWAPLFSGVTISEKLGTTIEGATLYKGTEIAELAAAEDSCYERYYEQVGHPYIIANAYAEGTQMLFCVSNEGKVVVPEGYELQATGLKSLGDDVYAKINGGKSTFSETCVTLNITFASQDGSVTYGTTNETFVNPTYKEVGTGVYTYGVEQLSQDAESFYEGTVNSTLYQCEQMPGNFYLKPWANSEEGLQFTIGNDGYIRFYQFTGDAYSTYGDVYFIDLESYNPAYTQYLGTYDEATKTYTFSGAYYIPDAGGFGLISETFVLGAEAPASARNIPARQLGIEIDKSIKAQSRFIPQTVGKGNSILRHTDSLPMPVQK